jgi:hypothetical protein
MKLYSPLFRRREALSLPRQAARPRPGIQRRAAAGMPSTTRTSALIVLAAVILGLAAVAVAPPDDLPLDAFARADALIRREAAASLQFLAIVSFIIGGFVLACAAWRRLAPLRRPDIENRVAEAIPVSDRGVERRSMHVAVELLTVLGLILVLFAINLATAEIYPLVWGDEAGYSDPGINLALGNGLTSSVWFNVYWGDFWYSFPPLFPGLIALWVALFDVSLTAVRSLNLVLISVTALALWRFALRSGLLPNIFERIAIVLIPLLGYGVSFSYRNARPDILGALLTALALNAAILPDRRWRSAALIAIGALVPWTAPQLPVFALIVGLLIGICWPQQARCIFVPLMAGISTGLAALFGFYAAQGSLYGFLSSTIGSVNSTPGQIAHLVLLDDAHGSHDLQQLPWRIFAVIFEDRSSVFLGAAALVVHFALRRTADRTALQFSRFAVSAAVGIPILMQLAGKYSPNYTWMGLLAIGIPVLACLGYCSRRPSLVSERRIAMGYVALALVIGLPVQLARAYVNRDSRDYDAVRAYVRPQVATGDWVYVSEQAYFAVAELGAIPVVDGYAQGRLAPGIPDAQRARIKLFIVHPDTVAATIERLGGSWQPSPRPPLTPPLLHRFFWHDWGELREPYRLVAYRRQ